MTMSFQDAADRYEGELLKAVIPFWERHAVDKEYGGYFTFLDRDGSVYDTGKLMWMQWRIVYMFATLAREPFARREWVDIARSGYEFLVRHGKDENGHYYFALDQRGTPVIAPYNIYSNCFAAMGAAALYAATGDNDCRKEAESAMANYMARMNNPKGRWEKKLPGSPKRRTLGNYMMLANLGRELNECLNTDRYGNDIKEAAHTVLDCFWSREHKVLFENVNMDGSVDLESCDGRHINPGHGLESMWFILNWAEQQQDTGTIERCCEIVDALLKFGWDEEYGGLYYFMDILGKPHMELQADMKLWWVHNEALLAVLYAYRLSGEELFA